MGYEIDFFAVGEKSDSGDAIAMRWGDLQRREQTVVVIDGGFKDNGDAFCNHIDTYYRPRKIDLVVSTHPDGDHIGGLGSVLDRFEVGELWLHCPWKHGNHSDDDAKALYDQAKGKGIPVFEPFQGRPFGMNGGKLEVLGPSESFYKELLPDFDSGGVARNASAMAEPSFFAKVRKMITDLWNGDILTDNVETSARNNSSAILLFTCDGRQSLFTADAGIPALTDAVDYVGDLAGKLSLIQIPHHGSRHNVGPTILNRLVGGIVPKGSSRGISAIASCAKEGRPKHPNQRVINAFTKRGCNCYTTEGINICFPYNAPNRAGWGNVNPCGYQDKWEEEEE